MKYWSGLEWDVTVYIVSSFLRIPFFKMMVPTVDTVRYGFLTSELVKNNDPVLLVGPVGTGKTSVAVDVCEKLDPKQFNVLTVNMSAQVGYKIISVKNVKSFSLLKYVFILNPKTNINHKIWG